MKFPATFFILFFLMIGSLRAPDQEWYKYWNDAETAKKEGRWDDVVDSLRISIRKEPKPKRNKKIQSGLRIDYFPYYWLAEAYFHLGKYESANEYIGHSESMKEILKDEEFQNKLISLKKKVQAAIKQQEEAKKTGFPLQPNQKLQDLLLQAENLLKDGRYEEAKTIFQQVQEEGRSLNDAVSVKQASDSLKDMKADESVLARVESFFQAQNYDKALEKLREIKIYHNRAKQLRADISSASIEQQTGQKVFTNRLQDIQSDLDKGKYSEALSSLEKFSSEEREKPEVRQIKAEIFKRIQEAINGELARDELDAADRLCRIAEEYQPASEDIIAFRLRITNGRKFQQAVERLGQKRRAEAETLFRGLLDDADHKQQVEKYLRDIENAHQKLKQESLAIQQLIESGDLDQAETTLEVVRKNFPYNREIVLLRNSLRVAKTESGKMAVEDYLREGLVLFFTDGDYLKAVFYFDEYLENGDRKDLALFFRAMSKIYLHFLEGDNNQHYMDEAQVDVGQISVSFQPPRQWLSRKAISLFDEWRDLKKVP